MIWTDVLQHKDPIKAWNDLVTPKYYGRLKWSSFETVDKENVLKLMHIFEEHIGDARAFQAINDMTCFIPKGEGYFVWFRQLQIARDSTLLKDDWKGKVHEILSCFAGDNVSRSNVDVEMTDKIKQEYIREILKVLKRRLDIFGQKNHLIPELLKSNELGQEIKELIINCL